MTLKLTCREIDILLSTPSSQFTISTPLSQLLRVLTLPENSSARDIKRRYKDLALVCHPDRCDDNEKELAQSVFQRLQNLVEAINNKLGQETIDLTLTDSNSDSDDSEVTQKIDCNDARLHGLYIGAVFPSKESLVNAVGDYANVCGFLFTQQLDKIPLLHYLRLKCNRAGKPTSKKDIESQPTKKRRRRRSLKVGCPWKVTATCELEGTFFVCSLDCTLNQFRR